jgi:acetylornithine deacetylase/succinyl-diaminopimelate desuccinylase-like protein
VVAQARRPCGTPIPVAMLFVPCRQGISHAKEEFVSPEQVARGAAAFREALASIAARGRVEAEPAV